jgi:HlyD family secretion protein
MNLDFKTAIKRKPFIFIVTAAVLLPIVLLVVRNQTEDDEIPLAAVTYKPLEVSVNAVGQLDSVNAVTISSELKGEIKIIWLIEDGTMVKTNDVLAKFDPQKFEENVFDLTSKVKEWEALVNAHEQLYEWEKNQAYREIRTAEYDLKVAKLELQKLIEGDGPLELSRLEEELTEKTAKYDELKGYIEELKELEKKGYQYPVEIAQAIKKLEMLEKEYFVAKKKYESYKNFFLPTSIETAKSKVERAKMILNQVKKGVGFKIGKANAELKKSKNEVEKFKRQLKNAENDLKKTVMRSPQAGLVVLKENFQKGEFRKPRVGDMIYHNQPILFLPDISTMMVKVLIREVDLNKLKLGKKVLITVDAYPDIKLTGKVSFIGALAERREEIKGSEKYFKANVQIVEKEELLRPGMTARVKIIAKEGREDVLTVPINAIFQENGKYFVFVDVQNSFQKREVRVGLQNLESAEILEGVEKDERVGLIKPEESKIKSVKYLKNMGKNNNNNEKQDN